MTSPLYSDPHFTFRFAESRRIDRFHLEGVPAGQQVDVYRINPATGEQAGLLAIAVTGVEGWVELAQPLIMHAGDAFIALPEADTDDGANQPS